MILRILLGLSFVLTTSVQAWACSCAPWEGGLVSEFVGDYTSFWGVPIQSELKPRGTDRPGLVVSYQIEVLESYDRITAPTTEIISSIEDGGSCGIQLTMGVPQFLSAYKGQNGTFSVGSCTPELPYRAIKDYLENGVDAVVPPLHDCLDEQNNVKFDNTDCKIWEGGSIYEWQRRGDEDWLEYLVSWRNAKTKVPSLR